MIADPETGEVLENGHDGESISKMAAAIVHKEREAQKRMRWAGPYVGADLAYALLAAQEEIGDIIERDAEGARAKYASHKQLIKMTRPILRKYGILIRQGVRQTYHRESNKISYLEQICYTQLTHVYSGESTSEEMAIPCQKIDPQAAMSALTYGKRATLCNVLGIATGEGDDDGERATQTITLDGDVQTPQSANPYIEQIKAQDTEDKLRKWGMDNRQTLASFADDIALHIRNAYRERMRELEAEAAKPAKAKPAKE